jgi:hypothetical protein
MAAWTRHGPSGCNRQPARIPFQKRPAAVAAGGCSLERMPHSKRRGINGNEYQTERRSPMTDTAEVNFDELGPVDYLVVEFPAGASSFTGEMAAELVALVESGTIRLIDVLILIKNDDGTVDAMELEDIADLGPLQAIETELAELLAADDVEHLAAAMEPGTTAGVLIWENLWAAPFASAARRSGGQLIANGRIPIQAIIASIEADIAAEEGN